MHFPFCILSSCTIFTFLIESFIHAFRHYNHAVSHFRNIFQPMLKNRPKHFLVNKITIEKWKIDGFGCQLCYANKILLLYNVYRNWIIAISNQMLWVMIYPSNIAQCSVFAIIIQMQKWSKIVGKLLNVYNVQMYKCTSVQCTAMVNDNNSVCIDLVEWWTRINIFKWKQMSKNGK